MTQNLYAGEGNDRGWYRVNRENKKLKCEIKRLNGIIKFFGLNTLVKENIKLRKALEELRKKLIEPFGPAGQEACRQIVQKALKGGPK